MVRVAQPFVQSEIHVFGINVKSSNKYLVLEFDWRTTIDPSFTYVRFNSVNSEFIWTVYNDNLDPSIIDSTIQFQDALIDQSIVECLFKLAKTMNVAIPIWLSKAMYVPFIYKGETLEEIEVKADLEDV